MSVVATPHDAAVRKDAAAPYDAAIRKDVAEPHDAAAPYDAAVRKDAAAPYDATARKDVARPHDAVTPHDAAASSGGVVTASAGVHPVTDATFAEVVLGSDLPVLVDFWAEWCPPCHAMDPVIAQVAAERADLLRVVTIDVDANREAVIAYGVRAMPTFGLFLHGQIIGRLVGARPKSRLLRELDELLGR